MGETMLSLRLTDVQMASVWMPPAEGKTRIVGIELEVEELSHIEEALVTAALANGESVERSAAASPASVLGVRVVGETTRRRAA